MTYKIIIPVAKHGKPHPAPNSTTTLLLKKVFPNATAHLDNKIDAGQIPKPIKFDKAIDC